MKFCLILLLSQKIETKPLCKSQNNLNVIIVVLVKIMKVSICNMLVISLQIKDMTTMNELRHRKLKSPQGMLPWGPSIKVTNCTLKLRRLCDCDTIADVPALMYYLDATGIAIVMTNAMNQPLSRAYYVPGSLLRS